VIPCVMLIVNNYVFLPSFIVLVADFGDFLDGVVARYWEDLNNKEDLEMLVTEEGKIIDTLEEL
jgi:phosphatidylserine synthase